MKNLKRMTLSFGVKWHTFGRVRLKLGEDRRKKPIVVVSIVTIALTLPIASIHQHIIRVHNAANIHYETNRREQTKSPE